MLATSFTRLVGCERPLQCAAMPGVCTPALVAAVTNAGGLGMIGLPMTPAEVAGALLEDLARRCEGPFGVNFLMPFLDLECVDAAAVRAPVIEFFYGPPQAALVDRARVDGAKVGWQVGSRAEAVAAADAGCDYVIAQGTEAGGHVRGELGLLRVLAEVLDAVHVPVVAAGGIGTAREMAAALAAGAAAVRIGTRMVATRESGAHPAYVSALVAAEAEDTVLTEAFSVLWPHAPHRVLRSSVEAADALSLEVVGETDMGGARSPVPRFAVVVPTRETTGNIAAMALYAGQSVGAVRGIAAAADVVRELCDGAERLLARREQRL